jgi:DtxR family Mn-dependent transcriptional regulator
VVQRVRQEVERHVFQPYLAYGRKFWWHKGDLNWNGVCNGAVGLAFMRLEREPRRLAEALSILPVSANQMVHKLSESGLVDYLPYKGASLTPPGRQIAMRILGCRRLWEVFLVNCLKLSLVDAGQMACDLEHITPPGAADRLSAFLDHPLFSPQGKPIPRIDGTLIFETVQPLIGLAAGAKGRVAPVAADPVTQAVFQSECLVPGGVLVQRLGDGAVLWK